MTRTMDRSADIAARVHALTLLATAAALLVSRSGAAGLQATPRTEPTASQAIEAQPRGYFRTPAIRGDAIVFTAEGDLWRVAAGGGSAVRLTTHPELETTPAISPDGRWLAYSATYEGPREVYLMPMAGGPAARQTWEGENATVVGWLADGRILYRTSKYVTLPGSQLAAIHPCDAESQRPRDGTPACSHQRELLPFAGAADAAVDAEGSIYFTRWPKQGSYTKRYIGGTAENIWKYAVAPRADGADASGPAARDSRADRSPAADGEAVPLTADYPGTSTAPMWWNGRLYFASDRAAPGTAQSLREHGVTAWDAGVMNIWSMRPDGSDVRQHTFHRDYDVATPSMDAGRIAYQNGADLWLLDLRAPVGTDNPRRLDIHLSSDFDQMRENWVPRPAQYLTSVHVSPSGDRIALTSRGRVFVAPVGSGRLVEVDRAQGVRYREATFMPDGRNVLALSDETGEVELWTLPANGMGDRTQITRDAKILRWRGLPSPDGRWIAHNDKNQDLFLYDTRARTERRIAHSDRESSWISNAPGFSDMSWSPDGRWLAYNDVAPNFLGRLVVYDTQTDTHTPITSDRYDSYGAAWSPDGKWLWFLSDRTFQSSVGSPWGPRQPDPYYERTTRLYGLALTADAKWPFTPPNELSSQSGAAAPQPTPARQTGTDSAATAVTPIVIDLQGIAARLYEVPLPSGDYSNVSTDGRRLYWVSTTSTPRRRNLMSLEIKREDAKPAPVIEDIAVYEMTADRKKLMVQKGSDIYVFDAGARAPQDLAASKVDLGSWAFSVDPAEEWQNNFVDAWRLERDYFYDPGMHGIDWPAMREKYAPLAARVTDRSELNDVISQMVGELSTLHIFVRGGDVRNGPTDITIATLGAVLDRDVAAGGWRIARIYRSDPDMPSLRSPLAEPGLNATEGDVITAIDGVPALSVPDPHVLLRNREGQQVRLSVKPASTRAAGARGAPPNSRSATAAGASMAERDIIVTPMSAGRESALRYSEWEYTRRLAVDSMSENRIGYVHLRAMSAFNMAEWTREYYPVFNRDALIIDVRRNSGGNIDSWLLGKLLRREWFWWKPRVGDAYVNMPYAFRGPIIVLMDEKTSSDGEAFAEGFRRLDLGKLLGVRTWGGEVWLSSNNFQADRGIATAAEQGVFAGNEWLIEGWGVDPDITVDNLPVATFNGSDAQLEAGVRYLLDELRRNPVAAPPVPAYPKKSGNGGR